MEQDLKDADKYVLESNRYIVGLIADYETVVGFLLAGIGEYIQSIKSRNYMMVFEDTPKESIEAFFRHLCDAKQVGVIFIGTDIFQSLRPIIANRKKAQPIIMEIPSRLVLENNHHPFRIKQEADF